jgi:hypothetical protein
MTPNINQELDKVEAWTQLTVAVCFTFAFLLGSYLSIQLYAADNENKRYFLTFKDDLTTFETTFGTGKVILTAHNNHPYSHQLKFYGLDPSDTTISKTDLSSQDGGIIEESEIVLTPDSIPASEITDPQVVDLIINESKDAGAFNGWLILSNNGLRAPIPIKASTPALFYLPIGWVVVGTAISIGLWEIVRYFKNKKLESEGKDLQKELDDLSKKLKESIELVEKIKESTPKIEEVNRRLNNAGELSKDSNKFIKTIRTQYPKVMVENRPQFALGEDQTEDSIQEISSENVTTNNIDQILNLAMEAAKEAETSAERVRKAMDRRIDSEAINRFAAKTRTTENEVISAIHKNFNEDMATIRDKTKIARGLVRPIKEKAEEEKRTLSQLDVAANINRTAAADVRNKIMAATKRVSGIGQKARIAIIDIITAGFGVAIALIGVLSNALVIELQAIGDIEILTLVGIGLGVGSLKEIVDKD